MALKADGSLWSFGENLHGQLGTTTNSGSSVANPTPTQVMTGLGASCLGRATGDTNCDGVVRIAVLGDSFISGEGAAASFGGGVAHPYQSGTDSYLWSGAVAEPENLCHRSQASWAYRVALSMTNAAEVGFFACSGATSRDVTDRSQFNEGKQIDELAAFQQQHPVDVVLMSVGGNDADFAQVVSVCLLMTACENIPWWASRMVDGAKLTDRLTYIQEKVAQAAPSAQVWVANYPDPTSSLVCPSNGLADLADLLPLWMHPDDHQVLTLDAAESAWISNTYLTELNDSVAAAAAASKAKLFDIHNVLDGHRLCSEEAWINGLTVGDDVPVAGYGPLGHESFHPNDGAHVAIADRFESQIAPTPGFATSPTWEGGSIESVTWTNGVLTSFDTGEMTAGLVPPGSSVSITGSGALPGAPLRVIQSSLPTEVARVDATGTGQFSATFAVPSDTPPGLHLFTVQDLLSGEVLTVTPLLVDAENGCAMEPGDDDTDGDQRPDRCDNDLLDGPLADFDGDGALNGTDNCPTVANPTQTDGNNDSVGNACDPAEGAPWASPRRHGVAAAFTGLTPARLLETRPGLSTSDGLFNGVGVRAAGSTTALTVTGRAGVPNDATDVVINVTVTGTAGPGFVTVYPCGSVRPTASSINFAGGQTIANGVTAHVGTGGSVCLYTSIGTHLIVDAAGFFPPGSGYAGLTPARLLETRPGLSTSDGLFNGVGVRAAGSTTALTVTGRAGVPNDATDVVINVTVTGTAGPGFVTVYPCGSVRPTASSINFAGGQTIANGVTAHVGTGGSVCLYTSIGTHLIVDAAGYHVTPT